MLHEGCEAAAISKGRGSNTEGVNTNPEERRNTVKIQTISGHTKHLPVIFNGMYVEHLESTNTYCCQERNGISSERSVK